MPKVGEFSQVILLHAIFEETWMVRAFYDRPLSGWTPSATRTSTSDLSRQPLTSIPTYCKWRNAACDCFDILHWHANSIIAQASGVEHPTVLQLHLARVVLLAPCTSLKILAEFLAENQKTTRAELPQKVQDAERDVLHWVCSDYHKARLSNIHAGVLFWHVRRFSRRAFYEAKAALLATLAIWAYGLFAAYSSTPKQDQARSNDSLELSIAEDDSEMPAFVRLDRPCDDELVQWYIRHGNPQRMTAHITNVGNICSSDGPYKMLLEGAKILKQLGKTWGIADDYAKMLTDMARSDCYSTR